MNNPKISIVTVCYNAVDVVEKTILSVINQTYENIEYIIIDGASTDGTVDIINKYKDKIAYFVSEPDKGIYDAMNKGIRYASGEWINFMNAGDVFYEQDTVRRFSDFLEDEASIIYYGDIIKDEKDVKYICKPEDMNVMPTRMNLFHQGCFIQTNYQRENQFDISFKSSADYNFFYHAYLTHVKFKYIPLIIAVYDESRGMSKDNYKLSYKENLRIWKKEEDRIFIARLNFLLLIKDVKIKIRKMLPHKLNLWYKHYYLRRHGFEIID